MTNNFSEPVLVKIKNPKKFTQVVMVLDNETVLKEIQAIRDKWGIVDFYPRSKYFSWQKKLGQEGRDKEFRENIETMRRRKGLDPIFDLVLKRAAVCNEVIDSDYKSAYLIPVPDPRSSDFKHAIVINPNTTKDDLLYVFEKFQEDIKASNSKGNKRLAATLPKYSIEINVDTRSEIQRDRKWYWLYKAGRSYLQIAASVNERGKIKPEDYRDNVIKQIKRYSALLKRWTFTQT